MVIYYILGGVAAITLLYIVAVYNRFINLRNGIESTLNQISVAMKKRLDMISQMVDSVKGEMKFEKSTLTEITKMRTDVAPDMDPEQMKDIYERSNKVLGNLMVQVENYPDLKASENVKQLIDSVQDIETEIARLRYTYNNLIQEFNTKRQVVPSNLVAGMFGFNKQNYLELEEPPKELQKRVDISFD